LYQIEVGGRIVEENDPTIFYLKRPESNKEIADALRLAQEAKQNDIQTLGKVSDFQSSYTPTTLEKVIAFVKNIIFRNKNSIVFAQEGMEDLERCIANKGVDISKLSPQDFDKLLKECEISVDITTPIKITDIKVKSPSDYLSCGMEIPVGEVFELTWDHLIEILDTIDEYVAEGRKLIEQQAKMNELARPCDCPCEGDEGCPTSCGACDLKCDLEAIRAAHQEVLKTREKMKEIAAHIELLTDGFFNIPTEDVCNPLNEEVRDDEEKSLCQGGGSKLISKHELITRKLNYSRYSFDECTTRPEHMEDVLEGRRAGKIPLFGPFVQEKDLERYTKTKKGNFMVNTSDFNWFCCSDSVEE
jgi:hypothetical protein